MDDIDCTMVINKFIDQIYIYTFRYFRHSVIIVNVKSIFMYLSKSQALFEAIALTLTLPPLLWCCYLWYYRRTSVAKAIRKG